MLGLLRIKKELRLADAGGNQVQKNQPGAEKS